MDWSQTLSLSFQGVLATFTVVLAIATMKLHRSTRRYADATEQNTKVSEKLLSVEQLDYVERVARSFEAPESQGKYRLIFMGKSALVGEDAQEWNKLREEVREACRKLTKELLNDVVKEFPQVDTE